MRMHPSILFFKLNIQGKSASPCNSLISAKKEANEPHFCFTFSHFPSHFVDEGLPNERDIFSS